MAVRAGPMSLQEVTSSLGYSLDDVLREGFEKNAILKALGFVFDSHPRRVIKGGSGRPTELLLGLFEGEAERETEGLLAAVPTGRAARPNGDARE